MRASILLCESRVLLPEPRNRCTEFGFKHSFIFYFPQDGIFYACESDNGLARVAGEQAVAFLSEYLGPNIWRGRVEQYHPRFVSSSDSKLVAIREL